VPFDRQSGGLVQSRTVSSCVSKLNNFDQHYNLLVEIIVEMAGIEPASERFAPRKSTSVAG
jgi:hypothetical protein